MSAHIMFLAGLAALVGVILGFEWLLFIALLLAISARVNQAADHHKELIAAIKPGNDPPIRPAKTLQEIARERGVSID